MRPNAHYFPYRLIRSLSKSAPFLCPVFHILLNNPWYFENYRKYRYDMPLFTLMARLRVRFVVFVGIAVTMVVLLFNMNTEFMVSQKEVVRFYMTPEFELAPQDENW
uniref:Small integral membrane protein 6 n=2 Tax=Bursaphelenchus xylophilus TaxID=6326 RepID=A0A1I7SJ58_BURXY